MKYMDHLQYQNGKLFWLTGLRVGREAGTLNNNGRWKIQIRGRQLSRYRIVWEMFNGPVPDGMCIDHINRNPLDDRIENLRVVTFSGNRKNRKRPDSLGVCEVGGHFRNKRWRAYIYDGRKLRVIGLYATFEEARAARLAEEERLNWNEIR